jgi:hypothetical protein
LPARLGVPSAGRVGASPGFEAPRLRANRGRGDGLSLPQAWCAPGQRSQRRSPSERRWFGRAGQALMPPLLMASLRPYGLARHRASERERLCSGRRGRRCRRRRSCGIDLWRAFTFDTQSAQAVCGQELRHRRRGRRLNSEKGTIALFAALWLGMHGASCSGLRLAEAGGLN